MLVERNQIDNFIELRDDVYLLSPPSGILIK